MCQQIPDLNLFMMCESGKREALTPIPEGFHVRHCRKNELELWKRFHFDDAPTAQKYKEWMTQYYREVYQGAGDLFLSYLRISLWERRRPFGNLFYLEGLWQDPYLALVQGRQAP